MIILKYIFTLLIGVNAISFGSHVWFIKTCSQKSKIFAYYNKYKDELSHVSMETVISFYLNVIFLYDNISQLLFKNIMLPWILDVLTYNYQTSRIRIGILNKTKMKHNYSSTTTKVWQL